MSYYIGNQTGQAPGMFPGSGTPTGYYWWEGSEAFAALINFWFYFGDSSYNDVVTQAMVWQAGPDANYEPPNQTFDLGNDDQAFWGFAAMTAAETRFPNPPEDQPQWLPLAQAVYNRQIGRWDGATCGGGLRWQFNPLNAGYEYKSTIASGALMQLAARLFLFTGDTQYSDGALRLYNWCKSVGFIDEHYNAYDGGDVTQNCSDVNEQQYSYNAGTFLQGTASMYNGTKTWGKGGDSDFWLQEATGFVNRSLEFFFRNNIPYEPMCEDINTCNQDMKSYKSQLMQWMMNVAKQVPQLAPQILPTLMDASKAAISVCNCGGVAGQCGLKWTSPGNCDGTYGMGQEINALNAIQIWGIQNVPGPFNMKTSDPDTLSQGDPNAGNGPSDQQVTNRILSGLRPITTSDKAGAGILTV
ncbi:MAG: hypothetical protein Q9162_000779, partial [Coniocarpon cinnabarinum]